MAWNNKGTIVKKDGECRNKGKHKYCFYWVARHNKTIANRTGTVRKFRCSLFNLDKDGYNSLPICNKTYGQTFDGTIDGTTTG